MAQFLNAVVTFYCFYFFRQQRETASVAVCMENIIIFSGNHCVGYFGIAR